MAKKMKKAKKSWFRRKPMPLPLLILVDLAVIGLSLVVFALFHHVIPRQEQAIGIVSQRVSSVAQTTSALAEATATPETATATPVPTPVATPTIEPTAVPATAEPVTEAAVQPAGSAAATAMPAPTHTATPTPEPTATPSPEPTAIPSPTPDPVGWFGTKFADKFTDGEVIRTENSYQSAYLNVSWENVRDLGTEIYIADVYVKDISCFQTCFADDTFGRGYGEWLRDMAERTGSILTVNGDFCGGRNSGVVIRNGMLYRDDESLKHDVCVLYWDGTMKTFSPREFDTEAEMARGAYQAWNFGPELLDENGKAMEDFNSSVKPQNPRTAIGCYEPGHYAIVVIDGRSYQSIGMSMKNLSKLMENLGCTVAYNLDGGESSEMVWGTERISVPYKNGRQNSDAIIIVDGQ